jgi:hypothetical protein
LVFLFHFWTGDNPIENSLSCVERLRAEAKKKGGLKASFQKKREKRLFFFTWPLASKERNYTVTYWIRFLVTRWVLTIFVGFFLEETPIY